MVRPRLQDRKALNTSPKMVRPRFQDRKAPGTSQENPMYAGQLDNYKLVLKRYFKTVSKVD